MRKVPVLFLLLCAGMVAVLQSCKKEDEVVAPAAVPDQTFVEEFDTLASALNRGWVITNASDPKGNGAWRQGGGNTPWFPAYSNKGSFAGFVGADYTSTSANVGVISNWLISPVVTMQNGDKISFYTRALQFPEFNPNTGLPTGDTTDYGNRLQVLINTLNETADVGTGTEKGTFEPQLDINPTYFFSSVNPAFFSPSAFPSLWTKFEVTVFGLNGSKKGRFAFRYFIEDGGVAAYGSGVAIDKVTYTSVNHK